MHRGEVISLGPSQRKKRTVRLGVWRTETNTVKPAGVDKHIQTEEGSWYFQKLHNATIKQKQRSRYWSEWGNSGKKGIKQSGGEVGGGQMGKGREMQELLSPQMDWKQTVLAKGNSQVRAAFSQRNSPYFMSLIFDNFHINSDQSHLSIGHFVRDYSKYKHSYFCFPSFPYANMHLQQPFYFGSG